MSDFSNVLYRGECNGCIFRGDAHVCEGCEHETPAQRRKDDRRVMNSSYFEMVGHTYKSAYRDCNFRVMAIMQGIFERYYGADVANVVCDMLKSEVDDGKKRSDTYKYGDGRH